MDLQRNDFVGQTRLCDHIVGERIKLFVCYRAIFDAVALKQSLARLQEVMKM